MKTKGDLSFNVIIVAIIAIIVLVVVIFIFSDKTGGVADNLNKCMLAGGSCVQNCEGGWPEPSITCEGGLTCCKGLIRAGGSQPENP